MYKQIKKQGKGLEKKREKVMTSKQASLLFKDIGRKDREFLEVAFLNSRYEVIERKIISIGTIDQVALSPRDILRQALIANCYGFILAHNHPSNDPTPSRADIEGTKKLNEACEIVGVKLIDHLVVTNDDWQIIGF